METGDVILCTVLFVVIVAIIGVVPLIMAFNDEYPKEMKYKFIIIDSSCKK